MPPHAEESQVPPSPTGVGQQQDRTTNGKNEIAEVLFLDIVGFTKLARLSQISVLERLQNIVRATSDFCAAKTAGQLIALPTGDGMALVFFNATSDPGVAISYAERISEGVLAFNETTTDSERIKIRMGIHSGTVVRITDINDHPNVAGDGINTAQRVMDCGDVGHILLSDKAYHFGPDRTNEYRHLGKVRVKHDQEIELYSLFHGRIGNGETPQKILWEKKKEEKQVEEIMRTVQKEVREAERTSKLKKAAVVGLIVLLMLLTALITRAIVAPKQNSPAAIAVRTFQPRTSKNYCSRAISQAVTEEFVRSFKEQDPAIILKQSPVVPTGSSVLSADDFGKQRDARYVLSGTVECNDANVIKSPDVFPNFNVAVHAELYDRDSGKVIWSTPESSTPFNQQLLTLQQWMFEAVADKIGVELHKDPTLGNAANGHWYYLLGRYWSLRRASAKVEDKKEFAQKAVDSYETARQSGVARYNALALAGLADIAIATAGAGKKPKDAQKEALDKALEAADIGEDQAVAFPNTGIDKFAAEAYAAIGTEKWWLERDFVAARIAFRLAIKLNPDLADAHKRYSACLNAMGEFGKADREMKHALLIEPHSTIFQSTRGQNLFFARNYSEAIKGLQDVIDLEPDIDPVAYRFLAMALGEYGQNQATNTANREALLIKALEKLDRFDKTDDSDILSVKAYILARLNRTSEARDIAQRLERSWQENANEDNVSSYNIAVIYAAMADTHGDSLKWLSRAINESDQRVAWLMVDPRFDDLRKTKENKAEFDKRLKDGRLPLKSTPKPIASNFYASEREFNRPGFECVT